MKTNQNFRYAILAVALTVLMTVISQVAMAQPPPPPPNNFSPSGAPIDGGVVLLVSSCLAYAYYKYKK